MFEHERMDDSRAKDLLGEILDDGGIVRPTFVPGDADGIDRLGEWQKLRDELMYKNRFFPDANIDLERLDHLLSHLSIEASEVPDLWYRARIQTGEEPFPFLEMGAPPRKDRLAWSGQPSGHSLPLSWIYPKSSGFGDPPAHRRNSLRC